MVYVLYEERYAHVLSESEKIHRQACIKAGLAIKYPSRHQGGTKPKGHYSLILGRFPSIPAVLASNQCNVNAKIYSSKGFIYSIYGIRQYREFYATLSGGPGVKEMIRKHKGRPYDPPKPDGRGWFFRLRGREHEYIKPDHEDYEKLMDDFLTVEEYL